MQVSRYPIWWDTPITVYNRYEDPQTNVVIWFRHFIPISFWKDTGNKVTVGDTVLETNDIICRIPEDSKFVEQYKWFELPNDQMGKYFTLGQGDIIVKGEVDDVIDEYVKGHRSTDFKAKYKKLQGLMEIEMVGIKTGPGRVCPHYYVRGI